MNSAPVADDTRAADLNRRTPPRWLARILSVDLYITGVLLAALVIITFLGVFMRYVFNSPFVWQEEVQLGLLALVVFLGSGAAFRTNSHVAIDFIVERFPVKIRRIVEIVVAVIIVAILVFFLIQSIRWVGLLAGFERTTAILKIPSIVIYIFLPIGLLSMIVNFIYSLIFVTDEIEVS